MLKYLKPWIKPWIKLETGRIPWMAWEWWIMRAGLAWVMYPAISVRATWNQQPEPVGIAQFMDLTWLESAAWTGPLLVAATVMYVLGLMPLLSTFCLFALQVMVSTLANSQGGGGGAHHTTNIVALVLLGQLLGISYHYMAAWRRGGLVRAWRAQWAWFPYLLRNRRAAAVTDPASPLEADAFSLRSFQINTMLQATAAAYVVSGISKLVRSGGAWLSEIGNIPLQFEKNRLNRVADVADPAAGAISDFAERAGAWIGDHPSLAACFFGVGLFLELFAFMGIWNRRAALLFGLGIILMHSGISMLMNLGFFYNKWIVALLWVNVPWWIYQGIQLIRRYVHPLHK